MTRGWHRRKSCLDASWERFQKPVMPFICLIVSKQGLKIKVMALRIFYPLLWVNLAHVAKHQTPFINQAATKPAVPGDEGDVLKSAWLCFILLPSLEEKQWLAVQPCLALRYHTHCSPLRCPAGSIHALLAAAFWRLGAILSAFAAWI